MNPPIIKISKAEVAEMMIDALGTPVVPSNAQRKPSTTPTMGLMLYASRHRGGSKLDG